jgi:predicted HAD superfamily hydrolase
MKIDRPSVTRQTISFDVFDTALRRTVRDPKEVFKLVGDAIDNPEFCNIRSNAQRDAHRFGKEASLEEIYWQIEQKLDWNRQKTSDVMQLELSTERSVIQPVPYTKSIIDGLRGAGFSICFVSDMYLPSEFIANVLDELGLRYPGERVFVSCEVGKSKRRGTLFPFLKRTIPDLVAHYGDDYFADVRQADRAGIKAEHTPSARPTAFERSLNQTVAEAARIARTNRTQYADKLWELGAGFTAPMAHGLLGWLEEEAESSGVDRLLFLARDAQILHALYEGAVPCNYVFLSRHSLNNCLFSPMDPSNREWIFAVETPTVRNVLSNCNLTPDDVETELSRVGVPKTMIDQSLSIGRLIRMLEPFFSNKRLQEILRDRQYRQREEFRSYLVNTGVNSNERLGIVDLGWQGSIQRRLTKILPLIGHDRPLKGFYFYCQATDINTSSYLDLNEGWLARYRVLIETMFPAGHGQTISYSNGKPVLGEYPHVPEASWRSFRDGAKSGVEQLRNHRIEPRELREAVEQLAKNPDWHSAELVSGVHFNAGLHEGNPFLQPRFVDSLRSGMPWPEAYFRWRYPGARGHSYRALQAVAWALREARYGRRWLLNLMFDLRKP